MPMKVRYTSVNGEIIAETRGGVRKHYLSDALGSTLALVDSTQTITDRFTYWPYGEEASRTGSTPTPFRFVGTQGYYRDRLKSIYVRARHYRPDVARWVTDDPAPAPLYRAPEQYEYAAASPILLTDRDGLSVWRCCAYIRIPPHCFVSTTLCGAWGVQGGDLSFRGTCRRDDGFLRPCPGRPGVHCPGEGAPGRFVWCTKVSDDAAFERRLCQTCMPPDCARGPLYIFPIETCLTWPDLMFICASDPAHHPYTGGNPYVDYPIYLDPGLGPWWPK